MEFRGRAVPASLGAAPCRRHPTFVTQCTPERLLMVSGPVRPTKASRRGARELVGERNVVLTCVAVDGQGCQPEEAHTAWPYITEQQADELADVLRTALEFKGRPALVWTAGMILEIASGRSPEESEVEYFQKLTGAERARWEALLAHGEPPIHNYDQVAPRFDKLMAGCDRPFAHSLSRHELEVEVERTLGLLASAPKLANYHAEAAWVMGNYQLIRTTMFPGLV